MTMGPFSDIYTVIYNTGHMCLNTTSVKDNTADSVLPGWTYDISEYNVLSTKSRTNFQVFIMITP